MKSKVCFVCRIAYPLFMYNMNYGKPVGTCKQCLFERRAEYMLPSERLSKGLYYDDLDRMVYQPDFVAWVRRDIDHDGPGDEAIG